jgi:hypothetical protein
MSFEKQGERLSPIVLFEKSPAGVMKQLREAHKYQIQQPRVGDWAKDLRFITGLSC